MSASPRVRHPSAACVGVVVALAAGNASAGDALQALEVDVRYQPVKALDVSGGLQVRIDEGFSRIERWLPESSIHYQIAKPVTLGTGYRLIYARNARGDLEIAHRVHLQTALTYKLKPFDAKLKYRLRLQDRFVRQVGEPTDHRPTLRNGLELSYEAWTFAEPFASAEHYLALDDLADDPTRRWKLMLGARSEVGSTQFELYYRLDLRGGSDARNRHIVGLGMRLDI